MSLQWRVRSLKEWWIRLSIFCWSWKGIWDYRLGWIGSVFNGTGGLKWVINGKVYACVGCKYGWMLIEECADLVARVSLLWMLWTAYGVYVNKNLFVLHHIDEDLTFKCILILIILYISQFRRGHLGTKVKFSQPLRCMFDPWTKWSWHRVILYGIQRAGHIVMLRLKAKLSFLTRNS